MFSNLLMKKLRTKEDVMTTWWKTRNWKPDCIMFNLVFSLLFSRNFRSTQVL